MPFAVFTLLLWPALEYGLYRLTGSTSASFWAAWVSFFPTSGPLWFVGLLLLLPLAYAGWRALRPVAAPRTGPIPLRALVLLAVAVGVLSFPIRLLSPYAGHPITALNDLRRVI